MSITPTVEVRYADWDRPGPGHRWERICEAEAEQTAWQALDERLPRGGNKLVTNSGTDPNKQRRPR